MYLSVSHRDTVLRFFMRWETATKKRIMKVRRKKYEEAVSVLPESSSDIGYYYLIMPSRFQNAGKSEQAELRWKKPVHWE